MRLSLAAIAIGLISVASACMEVIVQFNQYTSIIEMVYVYVRVLPSRIKDVELI